MSIAPLQLLVIEDNEDDFFLLQDALDTAFDKENITVEARRIDCAAAMEAALLEQSWDVIISDVCLPDFSAQAALEIYQAQQLDIPFIIISGVIREEDSVSLLKAGAHDFISKENFARLVPAILRELGDTAERHQHQQVKIAFHKDEEILEQIFATTNFLLAYMDKSFNFIRVNRAYAVAGKKQAEDFIGKNHFQLYPNQENEKIFQRVVDTGKPYFVQAKPFEHPEQIERNTTYWDWSLTPVTNALGETTGVLLSVVDVTDRIQAQIHAARLATVVEQAPVSIVITDTDANIIYTNPYFEKNTGYSAQEVLGKNPRMLQSGEHKSDFYENMWVQLTQGKTWFGHLINQRKNHQHYYEAASIFPIKDQAGKIVNYAAVKRDISAQIQAEKELKQHKNNLEELVTARTSKLQQLEQELKQIFELSIDMICIASMDGYFLKLNPAFEDILGYSKNELQAQSFFAFIHPEDRQKTKKMIQTQLGKGIQVLHFENRYRYKTGGYCWLEWNFHPEPQEQRIYAVARDISKRRHIEQQLLQAKEAAEAANQAKSIFLANMSHELRTPLNAILGFSQLMTHAPEVTLKQQEQLNTINRAGEHLLTMINDVLDLSKIEAGKTELHLENFDLHKMLKNLLEMFMFRAQTQGLSLEVGIDDSVLCYIQTDPGKLRQIITNLLGNALKFTKKGGVTLHADCHLDSEQKLWLHIDVEDTGVGIEANQLQAIFSPFVQVYSILQMEQKGTGLGLAISRSFIELMGGSIHAQSTPGKGTLFHFKIPIKKISRPAPVDKTQQLEITGLDAKQPKWRILVVDDDAVNRSLLQELLEQKGFSVYSAEDGFTAISAFQKWSPHLLLLDMRMPLMDGYQAARKIRELPGGKAVKIIAVTANVFKTQRDKILAAGCDDVLKKPYHFNELFKHLEDALGVRYTFAEKQQEISTATQLYLQAEDLTALPEILVNDLYEATLSLDEEAIAQINIQIQQQHPAVAKAIQALVSEYHYERLLELCEQALNIE